MPEIANQYNDTKVNWFERIPASPNPKKNKNENKKLNIIKTKHRFKLCIIYNKKTRNKMSFTEDRMKFKIMTIKTNPMLLIKIVILKTTNICLYC